MSLVTQYEPGMFCWIDLATSDAAGAEKFYTALFDWTTEAMPVGPDMNYIMCRRNGHYVAAFYQPPPAQSGGIPPHWKSYVSVRDADATAQRARELGGQVALEPMDVMTAGRMALIMDPTGAMIAIWQPGEHAGAGLLSEPGTLVWNELMTRDTKTAGEFYSQLFDWQARPRDMGYMVYTMFHSGDRPSGGMLEITAAMGASPPHWVVQFAVADTDASAARTRELGGQVLMPPTDIPQVGRFAVLADPQGASFAIMKFSPAP